MMHAKLYFIWMIFKFFCSLYLYIKLLFILLFSLLLAWLFSFSRALLISYKLISPQMNQDQLINTYVSVDGYSVMKWISYILERKK